MSKCCKDMGEECSALIRKQKGCGTKECGFYKPEGCSTWIRFTEGGKEYITPPESRKNKWDWVEL